MNSNSLECIFDPSSRKRKADDDRGRCDDRSKHRRQGSSNGNASLVAKHYNSRHNASRLDRKSSKIYYMRNFNNWIKSVFIRKYVEKVNKGGVARPIVLDLGAGKGGDLLKWDKGNVSKVILTDLADTSVAQCRERYETMKRRAQNKKIFEAEFCICDSGQEELCKKFASPETVFDMTSCMFVMHYSFESERQADMMVQNACRSLKPGGYFIGTTLDADKLASKLRASEDSSFGNDVYRVAFCDVADKSELADYGCKYIFQLHGVVDCPEFLLKKQLLVKLCQKYGMRLLEWKPFAQFFQENSKDTENYRLIRKMEALEMFPARNGNQNSKREGDYSHAEAECARISSKYPSSNPRVATLSKTEWEAASLYVVYAFVKECDNVAPSKMDDVVTSTSDNVISTSDNVTSTSCKVQDEKIPLVIC